MYTLRSYCGHMFHLIGLLSDTSFWNLSFGKGVPFELHKIPPFIYVISVNIFYSSRQSRNIHQWFTVEKISPHHTMFLMCLNKSSDIEL